MNTGFKNLRARCSRRDAALYSFPATPGLLLCVRVLLCIFGLGWGSITAAEARDLNLRAYGEPATVFRWTTQRCDDLHIPDSPARALRLPNGNVMMMSSHLSNITLLGRDFDTLAPVCSSTSRGAENPDPTAFDDRFWVQALAPLPDGRVLGLASHEYMGGRHPGWCESSTARGGHCWYSSIVATAARIGDWRFRLLPAGQRVVAASPVAYDRATAGPSGFFSVTNIVFDGEFAYLLVSRLGIPGQRAGTCLLRAPRTDLVEGWRALAGGEFRLRLDRVNQVEAPAAPKACDLVGENVLRGAVRSLVRLGPDGPWAAVLVGSENRAGEGRPQQGVVYSLSTDLRYWSPPKLLWAMEAFRGQPEAGLYYQYPSLIDHASRSPVFDEVGGRLYLYLTRFNLQEDRRRGMDRDLVRMPVDVISTP